MPDLANGTDRSSARSPAAVTLDPTLGHDAATIEPNRIGDDRTCPFEDAQEMVANMRSAKLNVAAKFVAKADLDGEVFTSSGHALGDRTQIVLQVAGEWLRSPDVVRKTRTDFERREEIRYPVNGGAFVISYAKGYPIGRFDPDADR